MNVRKKMYLFTILLITYSCNSGVKIKEQKIKADIEKNSGIIIPGFKFIEEPTTEFAIGDWLSDKKINVLRLHVSLRFFTRNIIKYNCFKKMD